MTTNAGRPRVLLLNPPAPDWVIRDYYCSFPSKAKYYWPPQDLLGLSGLLVDGAFHGYVLYARDVCHYVVQYCLGFSSVYDAHC